MIGRFEEAILRTLITAGGEAPMGDIYEALAANGKSTTFGALYTSLHRMGSKKLVTRWQDDPRPMPGGRSRYFYTITNTGRAAVVEVDRAAAAFGHPLKVRTAPAR